MEEYLRHKRYDPIFQRPKSKKQKSKMKSLSSSINLELPNIHTKSLRHKIPQVDINDKNRVRKQIGKIISFVKDRQPCLLPEFYQKLPQKVKALGYTSPEYFQKLTKVNEILGSCDMHVKERDVILAKGQQSQFIYVFFTNFMYHPQSLCCRESVILKCIERQGIQGEQTKLKTEKWQFLCIECSKILLKLSDHPQNVPTQQENHLQKRKLLDFALHIASGRYKKHTLEEDPSTISFQHVKSRFRLVRPRKITQSVP